MYGYRILNEKYVPKCIFHTLPCNYRCNAKFCSCSTTTSTTSFSCMGEADLACCLLPFLQSMLGANQSVMTLTTSALQSEKLCFCRQLVSPRSQPMRCDIDIAAPDFPSVRSKLFTAHDGQQKAETFALPTADDSETKVTRLRISKPKEKSCHSHAHADRR